MLLKKVFAVSKKEVNLNKYVNNCLKEKGQAFFKEEDAKNAILNDDSLTITKGLQPFGENNIERHICFENHNILTNSIPFYLLNEEEKAMEYKKEVETLTSQINNLKIKDKVCIYIYEFGGYAGKIKSIDLNNCKIVLEDAVMVDQCSKCYNGASLAEDIISIDMYEIAEIHSIKHDNNEIFLTESNERELRKIALAKYLNIDISKIKTEGYNICARENGKEFSVIEIFKFHVGSMAFTVLYNQEIDRIKECLNLSWFIPQFKDWDNQDSVKIKKFIEPNWNTKIEVDNDTPHPFLENNNLCILEYNPSGDIEILINTKEFFEAGYGYVYNNEECFISCMYQNHLKINGDIAKNIEDLGNTSKCYMPENNSSISALKAIFDFWSISDSSPITFEKFKSFNSAFNYMVNKNLPYIIFNIEKENLK